MGVAVGGVIDQFFVALGFKVDDRSAKNVKKVADDAKEQLLGIGTALKVFATGIAIKGIADIGSTFESNTIAIAGFLSALGISSDFNAGLQDAEKTIASINSAAALLPGEAEEYIEVFRAGLPVLKGAMPGGSLNDMTEFTNRFTAIGKTLQVDAQQIGRDLSLMLGVTGRAGAHVLTFQRMLPFIRQLKGQAALTAETFNQMTQPKRLELMKQALANPALTKMLEAASSSFDAMLGAAKSMLKTVIRLSTAGIFKGMKKGLDELNKLFVNADGSLTAMGQSFVDGAKKVMGWIGQIVTAGAGFLKMLFQSETGVKVLKAALVMLGLALTALAWQKTIAMVTTLMKLLLNFKALILGGVVIALALVIEDLYMFLTGGKSVIGLFKNKFPTAFALVTGALTALAAAFLFVKLQAVAAGIATAVAWSPVLVPILAVVAAVGLLVAGFVAAYKSFPAFAAFVDQTARGFVVMAEGIERAVEAMAELMGFLHESDEFKKIADQKYDRNGVSDVDAGEPTFLQRPSKTSASSAVTKTVTTSSGKQVNVHVDKPHVIIQTNDPQKMGEEFHRQVTRNGQKGYL